MSTKTDLYKDIIRAYGDNPDNLPDNLETTLLNYIARCMAESRTFEFERDIPYYADNTFSPSVGLDRTYNGDVLDISHIVLSAYIVDNTTGNEAYFIHDITRAMQGIEDGKNLSFELGGVAPENASDGLNIYGFKVDIKREGHVYKLQTSGAVTGNSFAGATLRKGRLTNVKIRSILSGKITML